MNRKIINIGPPDTGLSYQLGDVPRAEQYIFTHITAPKYAALGKLPPRHYDETVPGQVTVSSYASPGKSRTFLEPEGIHHTFTPETRQPVADILKAGFGLGGVASAIGGAVAGWLGVPDVAITGATTAVTAYQAATKVETGGNDMVMQGTGSYVPVSGPGVPEPPREMVAKQWKVKSFSNTAGEYWVYFFRLMDGRIMCYNGAKRSWKMWRPKKPIVLYRGSVTLSQAVKAQTMLDRLWKRVAKRTKALKMA